MCSGMHSQEYPTQTRGIFPSTPQGLPRPFWEMTVSQQTKKSLEQHRNKRQRDRIEEVLKKSAELGEEVFCGWGQDLSPTWHLCFVPQALLCLFLVELEAEKPLIETGLIQTRHDV